LNALRVAIAGGAGGVGSSLAYSLLMRPEPFDVVVIDRRPQKVASHVMDLELTLGVGGGRSVSAGGWDDLTGADVLVICAATALTDNVSRSVYLDENAAIVDAIAARLTGWDGVVVMVTNPVDPLSARLALALGDRRRVVGYTLNDTLRLRTSIAASLRVPASSVEAWVLGEHGDRAVPIFSRVRVDGEPVVLSSTQRDAALDFVGGWYQRHVALDSGRSSTWTSGAGVARMVAAIAAGDGEPWVGSVLLDGEYGLSGVAFGVPVILGPAGVERVVEWELAPAELAALRAQSPL
jgi:malate/lactate dehydrogenase